MTDKKKLEGFSLFCVFYCRVMASVLLIHLETCAYFFVV